MIKQESFEEQIGNKITALRKIYEMDLGHVCEKTGISKELLEKYENGRAVITLAHLYKITSVFNLSLSYFLKDW